MKKWLVILTILFLIYAFAVNFFPAITEWDRSVIAGVQERLRDFPSIIPVLAGNQLYSLFIALPLVVGIVYFFKKYLLIDLVLFISAPIVAYIFNSVLKIIVQRPRPPLDLQLVAHSDGYSFVSNHTFITCTLWGLVIFYLLKYCKNRFLKFAGVTFGVFWMIFEGFSRVWLGVHNPTDVLGGYFLAAILSCIYIHLIKLIGGKWQ